MQLVYGVIGAVIGFYVGGGPTGAYYGFVIGYSIGGAIEASNKKIVTEGPRLEDLRVTISSYGKFIPRVYVCAKIGGNIIEATDLTPTQHETATESEGKGGPTTIQKTTTYSSTFRVLVCKSDGDRTVSEIFANGKLIWSRAPDADPALLLVNLGLVGQIIIYTGADDQLPDPTTEALYGIGNVPAYLGVLSVMFVDFQLADYSNNVAATQLTFKVVQAPPVLTEKLVDEKYQGFDPLFDKTSIYVFANEYGNGSNSPQVWQDTFDGSGFTQVGTFQTSDNPIRGLVILTDSGFNGCPFPTYKETYGPSNEFHGPSVGSPPSVWRLNDSMRLTRLHAIVYDYNIPPNALCEGDYLGLQYEGPGSVTFYSPVGQLRATLSALVTAQFGLKDFRRLYAETDIGQGNSPLPYLKQMGANGLSVFAWAETIDSTHGRASYLNFVGTRSIETVIYSPFVGERICGMIVAGPDQTLYVMTEGLPSVSGGPYPHKLYLINTDTGTITNTFPGPLWAYTVARFDMFLLAGELTVVDKASMRWKWSAQGALTVGDLISFPGHVHGGLGGAPSIPAASSSTLFWESPTSFMATFQDRLNPSNPADVYQRTYLYANSLTPGVATVSNVIAQIAAEKGYGPDDLDFRKLPDECTTAGYTVTRQTGARVAIDYLRDFYRIDVTESGPKIKFVLRGGPIVRELTMDDLGAFNGDGDPPEGVAWNIADELSLPAQVIMKYADRANNFEIGAVIAKRETTTSKDVRTLDVTALALTGDEAAKAVEIALSDFRTGRETFKISFGYMHEDLEGTDPIIIPGAFKKRRVRITNRVDHGGWIDADAVRDDPEVLTQYVIGGAAGGNPGQPPAAAGTTPVSRTDILNLPQLRREDKDAGFYVFVSPTSHTKYRGGTVYDRVDTGTPRQVGTIPNRGGARGFATTVLNNYTGPAIFDGSSFVDVQFAVDVALESSYRTQVFRGRNVYLIGGEIVGVLQTTVIGNGVMRLHGGLLRGMRGTESAISTHAVGEKVFWLNSTGMVRDTDGAATVDHTGPVSVGAVSVGRSLADLERFSTQGINTAQAQLPFAPVHVAYGFGADFYVLRLKWVRRSRLIQSDPFRVPADEPDSNGNTNGDSSSFGVEVSATEDFASGGVPVGGGTGDRGEWVYSHDRRYYNYMFNVNVEPIVWIRVGQVGPRANDRTRVGAYSKPIRVDLTDHPLQFPYGLFFCSTKGPDGETAFYDPRYLPDVVVGGIATGSVHKQNDRAVFSGGTDALTVYGGAMPLAVGIATIAIQTRFKTSAAGHQMLIYHGTEDFTAASWRIEMNDGRLSVYWNEAYGTIGQPIFTTTARFNDGVEHLMELFTAHAGATGGFQNVVVGLKMDAGASSGGGAITRYPSQYIAGVTVAELPGADANYVMGNNRSGTAGFVGTMGDLRGTVLA